jgi:hypothetical protein
MTMLLLAQAGTVGGLGQLLIYVVVLVALWAVLMAMASYFALPPLVTRLAGIVVGAIVAVLVIKILLSLL